MQSTRNTFFQAFNINSGGVDWLYAGQLHVDLHESIKLVRKTIIAKIFKIFIQVSNLFEKITVKKKKNYKIYLNINKNCIFM